MLPDFDIVDGHLIEFFHKICLVIIIIKKFFPVLPNSPSIIQINCSVIRYSQTHFGVKLFSENINLKILSQFGLCPRKIGKY